MVLLLQSFSCSAPDGDRTRLTGVQFAVTLLVHTVLFLPLSMMRMVPLGLTTMEQGPVEVVLVVYVTLPVLSFTVMVQLSLSVALPLPGGTTMLLGPVGLTRTGV